MRNRAARILRALLPPAVRADLFDPVVFDLEADTARGRRRSGFHLFLAFLECWRLAPAEVLSVLAHDIRYALRLLRHEPGFTVAAVLTLALGVGANVAVFAIVNAALLRSLPLPDADRLFVVRHHDRRTGISKDFVAIGDFVDLRARQRSFVSFAGWGVSRGTLYGDGEPFDASVLAATPELLSALRVEPVIGRALVAADAREGAAPVVMLGYDLWQQRFGGDPRVLGRALDAGTVKPQIVGVAPPGFHFPIDARTDLVAAMELPLAAPTARKGDWTFALGRLRAGVSLAQAREDLSVISRQMEQEHPADNQGSEYDAVSVRDAMIGDAKQPLLMLLGAVGLVLLIACVNVANLLVARAVGRRQEIAVRIALGASRGRLVAQSLTESLVLASIAGATALIAAEWTIPALAALLPATIAIPGVQGVRVDATVLWFGAAVTLLTTLVFGSITAFGSGVSHPGSALTNPGRVTAGRSIRRASSALVAAQLALAIVLLVGAGLVLRSVSRLLTVDPGFTIARVLTLDVELPPGRYPNPVTRADFYARAFSAFAGVSGIESAGSAVVCPLTGNNWTIGFERQDQPVPAGQRPPDVGWQAASGGYFRALRIPLRDGRLFNGTDRPGGPPVVIISDAIAERFFPGERAVGRRIKTGDGPAEIVGVVGSIRRAALTDEPRLDVYFPAEQAPQRSTTLFLRTSGDPLAAIAAVRASLRAIEARIVVREIRSMDEIARESVQTPRLVLWLLGTFAVCALALAAVGIYGVMAYSVRQRTREIGMRIALGATGGNIVWLMMRDGVTTAALGAGVGLVTGLAASRALSSVLFGTSPADPLTLTAATVVLLSVAAAACYVPARRAARVDPVRTLTQ